MTPSVLKQSHLVECTCNQAINDPDGVGVEVKLDEHVIPCFSLKPTAIDYREPKRFGYHAA